MVGFGDLGTARIGPVRAAGRRVRSGSERRHRGGSRGGLVGLDETDAGLIQAFTQHFILTDDIEPEWRERFEKALRTRLSCGYDSRYNATREEAEGILRGAEDFVTLAKRQLELELKRMELPNLRMRRPGQPDESAQNSGSPG